MKKTVNESQFVQAFDDYGRGNQFSISGRRALFDYFEQFEEETGQEMELDVIAICCEFMEFESIEEFQQSYGEEYESLDDIEYNTIVIPITDDSFIIQQF